MNIKYVVKVVTLLIPLLSATCSLLNNGVDTVAEIKALKERRK